MGYKSQDWVMPFCPGYIRRGHARQRSVNLPPVDESLMENRNLVRERMLAAFRVAAAQEEVDGADWQLHAHGNAMHGFTNPITNSPANGVFYNRLADERRCSSRKLLQSVPIPISGIFSISL